MRNLIAGMIVYTVFGTAPGMVTAQSPQRRAIQPTDIRHRGVRKTLSEELVFQRALLRARQRETRIQSRKWSGRSILRPGVWPRYRSVSVQRYWYGPF